MHLRLKNNYLEYEELWEALKNWDNNIKNYIKKQNL